MKTGSIALLAGLAAMSMSHGSTPFNDGSIGHGIPDDPKKIVPAGCKEYTFYGITVVALSEKRARIKAKKIFDKQSK